MKTQAQLSDEIKEFVEKVTLTDQPARSPNELNKGSCTVNMHQPTTAVPSSSDSPCEQ